MYEDVTIIYTGTSSAIKKMANVNSINGSIFHEKLKQLLPRLSNSITPELLNNICNNHAVQPFFKWFYENVSSANILTEEDFELAKHIKKNSTWLQGEELDKAIKEAVKDCPDLLKLSQSDYWNGNQANLDFSLQKELSDADFEYLQSIGNSIKRLRSWEEKLASRLIRQLDHLNEEEAKVKLIYEKCELIMEDFNSYHRQFCKTVELLASTYTSAEHKKGESCLWVQMPIELYIKQIETYNEYINSFAKRQFSTSKNESECNRDQTSFLSDSIDNEKMKELIYCQKNLLKCKAEEVIAKSEEEASKSLANYAAEIYNNGNLKTPPTQLLVRAEIAELTNNRDYLEEDIFLQKRQLVDIVQYYSKAKITKVLEQEAEVRLQRKKNRLIRLEKMCSLAREHGHAYSIIICMLFELQIHRINEIVQFAMDARHYLSMEYSLSSIRNETMQQLQREYNSLVLSFKDQNTFCETFIEIATIDSNDFAESVQYYNILKTDNTDKLISLLNEKLMELTKKSDRLENVVLNIYNAEISRGPTRYFKVITCDIQDKIYNVKNLIENVEVNVETNKNQLKSLAHEASKSQLDREKLLIWQKFLADPESLKYRFKELERLRDHY